jgi:hypothetical protein
MRRCRHIIVVDADADRNFEFEDLGNVVRKIEIDFGVPIRFPLYPNGFSMKRGVDGSNAYYAVGDIHSECVDTNSRSCCTPEQQGITMETLLYIKPCLNGSEPLGIKAYATPTRNFPMSRPSTNFSTRRRLKATATSAPGNSARSSRSSRPIPPLPATTSKPCSTL